MQFKQTKVNKERNVNRYDSRMQTGFDTAALVLANLFSVEKLKHLEIQEKDLFNKNELFFCTKACR